VLSHLGAIIIGSLLTKSRIISKEALPDTIIPALSVVVGKVPVFRMVSIFLEAKCFDKESSLTIPLRYMTCCTLVLLILCTKLCAEALSNLSNLSDD
jgi:hypothetical protein